LGLLLFSLASFKLAKGVASELNIWNLDDGIIAGDVDILIRDFEFVRREGPALGLFLNESKFEIYY